MKQKISAAVIILASLLMVLGTLITNRIQTASIQATDRIAPDRQAAKVSFAINKMDFDQPLSDTLRNIYSSSGGMLVISGVNFILLSSTLLWVLSGRVQAADIKPRRNLE